MGLPRRPGLARPHRQRIHAAEAGEAPDADLILTSRFEDFVDLTARRRNPLELLATRRLKPRGSLRLLWRMPKMFAA